MAEVIYLGTDEIRAGNGKFRSSRRYVRASATSTLPVAQTRTLDMTRGQSNDGATVWFRYAVGSYVISGGQVNTGSTYTASVTNVTL